MGLIFYNTDTLSWFSSADREQTMNETFSVLTTALEKHDELRFTITRDELKVNGDAYEFITQFAKAFVRHLCDLAANNLKIIKGLTREEFSRVMEFTFKKPSEIEALGGFTTAIKEQGFACVSSKKLLLKEVTDDEIVVAKRDVQQASKIDQEKRASEIVSFLSAPEDEAQTEGEQKEKAEFKDVVQDAPKMSELIMQAVEKKQEVLPEMEREQVAGMIVECMDKAFHALLDEPFSKTQKGKKAIASALKNLEQELLSKLPDAANEEENQTISTAVERMTERLKMDAVVQDYSRKLKSLEESEKRILRFMKLQGLDRLNDPQFRDRLDDEGLDVSALQSLLAMGGGGSSGDLEDAAHDAVTQLAGLLGGLISDVESTEEGGAGIDNEKLAQDLQNVESQVETITRNAEVKISKLVEDVKADEEAATSIEEEAMKHGINLRMSRRKLMEVMGEVVQELCQPLAVITCSIEMIEAKSLGEVTQGQSSMLDMALKSADKIKTLVTNLGRISGQLDTRSPDKKIQDFLNQPVEQEEL
jgi:hypothetical protein